MAKRPETKHPAATEESSVKCGRIEFGVYR